MTATVFNKSCSLRVNNCLFILMEDIPMDIALCETAGKEKFNAGSKARKDALKIAIDLGYNHIPLFHNGENKLKIMVDIIISSIKAMNLVGKGDWIFIQYPYYPWFINYIFIQILKIGRKFKEYYLVLLVHDLVAPRKYNFESKRWKNFLHRERKLIKKSDKVIVHNSAMQKLIASEKLSKYQILGPFDYLCEDKMAMRANRNFSTVVIAGNLEKKKSAYIYDLDQIADINFNLYGSGYINMEKNNISYKGSFPPEKIIQHMQGEFGLVWDGGSCETCSGIYGQYLKYNNPHKFSLYLAAGIPVIVWDKSALANYVTENNIGICVESLYEIPEILSKMRREKYKAMKENVMRLRADIIAGMNLKRQLEKIKL